MTLRPPIEIGVDIGGTFTDVVARDAGGQVVVHKLLSTPDDHGRGIAAGIAAALREAGATPAQVARVVHGTTVATNAILEQRGALTGLLTTQGFRDVLEMRRLRIPEMQALNWPKPEPLVPRRLRLEAAERLGPEGELRLALDPASVRAAAARFRAEGVEAVAVSFINAHANPAHERAAAAILREELGEAVFVTCGTDILPVIREYERTSTAVINAYLGPVLRRYFASLARHLGTMGLAAPLLVMKSDGGIMSAGSAAERPAAIVESGPAAGVIGAAALLGALGRTDGITLDMGGTTAKASMIEDGQVSRTSDYEVGAGINLSSKLVMGGGHALKLPVIDVSEIGAGGGSLVGVDAGGLLRVGPRSAGSQPGPVAYGRGGTTATFTDAVLTLGWLNPGHLVGGALVLDAPAARAALDVQVAARLRRHVLDAAHGVFEVACGTMVRAVKAVSTYRGRDPRGAALVAFGGNGPVVAAALADMLEMRRVIVPPHPGVFSAIGLLLSAVEHEAAAAWLRPLSAITPAALDHRFAALEADVRARFAAEGTSPDAPRLQRLAELRYAGQAHELAVAVPAGPGGLPDLGALAAAFGAEHERSYGHQAEAEAVECVTLRVTGTLPVAGAPPAAALGAPGAEGARPAWFGPAHGLCETPVLRRAHLAAGSRPGPLIVEEYDATCVVPPGWQAGLGAQGAILLERS